MTKIELAAASLGLGMLGMTVINSHLNLIGVNFWSSGSIFLEFNIYGSRNDLLFGILKIEEGRCDFVSAWTNQATST